MYRFKFNELEKHNSDNVELLDGIRTTFRDFENNSVITALDIMITSIRKHSNRQSKGPWIENLFSFQALMSFDSKDKSKDRYTRKRLTPTVFEIIDNKYNTTCFIDITDPNRKIARFQFEIAEKPELYCIDILLDESNLYVDDYFYDYIKV